MILLTIRLYFSNQIENTNNCFWSFPRRVSDRLISFYDITGAALMKSNLFWRVPSLSFVKFKFKRFKCYRKQMWMNIMITYIENEFDMISYHTYLHYDISEIYYTTNVLSVLLNTFQPFTRTSNSGRIDEDVFLKQYNDHLMFLSKLNYWN